MDYSVTVISTLLLTVLLAIGLLFFLRASVKERTQELELIDSNPQASLLPQLRQYFGQRSYQVIAVDGAANQVTFEGLVRPSVFLAVFLTLLSAIGLSCLALILSILFSQAAALWAGLVGLSPLIGLFYWRGAKRLERVLLTIDPDPASPSLPSRIVVKAHRDELAELQRWLALQ